MSIVNQIPPLNLNPILILLQKLEYQYKKNKSDVLSVFDNEIDHIDKRVDTVQEFIDETERGVITKTDELARINANTEECSVVDKNKRKQNVLKSLKGRKNELDAQKKAVREEREQNKTFYNSILDVLRNILNTIIDILKRLLKSIFTALTSLEAAIISLSALPMGVGAAPATSLKFVMDLLQTKIYEPVADTISQQKRLER